MFQTQQIIRNLGLPYIQQRAEAAQIVDCEQSSQSQEISTEDLHLKTNTHWWQWPYLLQTSGGLLWSSDQLLTHNLTFPAKRL